LTPTLKSGKLSPDASSNADPTTKEKMKHNTGCDHQKHEGRALRLPSTTPMINDKIVMTPCPTRGMTDIDWKSPDLHQGMQKDGSNPPQQPTTTDTALHAGEPLLHLGCEIGPHMSARPTEVANHHRPPPKLALGEASGDQIYSGT
jgi:hypothetical protein